VAELRKGTFATTKKIPAYELTPQSWTVES
jgi:hypothetical protein